MIKVALAQIERFRSTNSGGKNKRKILTGLTGYKQEINKNLPSY